jgi:biopolymer transport protein ExbD
MSMAVGGKKGGAIADINVTPMADIMIVLLIIFMVITPMLQKGVDVRLPSAANPKERNDSKTIEVAIKRDTTTFLKGLRLDKQQDLVQKLKEALEERADTQKLIYLKADMELPYAEVMKVMDLCREAGVEEVALIAEQKVQGGGGS